MNNDKKNEITNPLEDIEQKTPNSLEDIEQKTPNSLDDIEQKTPGDIEQEITNSLGDIENSAVDKLLAKQAKKNAKRAQKKAAKNGTSAVATDDPVKLAAKQVELEERVRSLVNQLAIREALASSSSTNTEKDSGVHKFWSTQPVIQNDDVVEKDGPIEPNTPHDEIRKEPYGLPKEFEWSTMELNNPEELTEIYTLLTNNYVEDDDAMFRFDYSEKFLKWALQPPGYKKVWHVGVRVASTKKLVAFISGIPADIRIYESRQHLVEINFLCVHKKLRNKRLAPVLIKEITRRSHLEGIFQAVYTAGVVLPKPISRARYYHRSLNPKKLIDTNFSRLPNNMTLTRMIKKYKVPEETSTAGLRPMKSKDVPKVRVLLNEYMSKFNFVPIFKNDEEIRHWILPKEGVVWSYVVEAPGKHITDFFSFYSLPSTVIGHPVHKAIDAVYLFYYATNQKEHAVKERLQQLMKDALILAKLQKIDVFNCLDLMENTLFLDELKFGPGDGYLNYYMFNWRCKDMESSKVGVVML
ncbi:4381_t:CDS:2 [Ambispora gerdemannii]|uniref:Glycylpeptide N-tetradecanoyltransferase n=1 Tax=Ambispora gerdemannii TaxID=144530 RepID=A0A9N9FPY2_9GLOM|nr:4381_t:CDS:2 [Ambispora gerdemannii]